MDIGEVLSAEWRHLRHPRASAAHAAAAVTIKPATTGGTVSLATDLHAVATRLENIGEEGVRIAEAVTANPEAQAIAADLAHLAGLSLPPGTLAQAGAAFKAILALIYPPQAPDGAQQQPAGPQVGGQA